MRVAVNAGLTIFYFSYHDLKFPTSDSYLKIHVYFFYSGLKNFVLRS